MTSLSDARRRRLQRLLTAARERIDPAELGLKRPRDPRGKKARGLTQSQVARALGCSTQTYNKLECGRGTKPAPELLQRVAEILHLNEHQWRELWTAAVGHGPPWPLHPDELSVPDIWRHAVHQLEIMAYLSDPAWDVLESNDAFARMFPAKQPPANVLRWMLLDQEARTEVLLDWEDRWCPGLISQLIAARAAHPHNAVLEQLDADVRADDLAGAIYAGDAQAFTKPDNERPMNHAVHGHGWAHLASAQPVDSPGARLVLIDFRAASETDKLPPSLEGLW